jgi:hypothetical protein
VVTNEYAGGDENARAAPSYRGRSRRPCECSLERLVDRLKTTIDVENAMSRAWVVKHRSEKSGEVVPRNLAAAWRGVDAHSTGPGIVC